MLVSGKSLLSLSHRALLPSSGTGTHNTDPKQPGHSRPGGKVRAELLHDGSVAQPLLRMLSGGIVFFHILRKGSQ